MSDKIKILAIESSCDETAAAVVEDGRCVKSNIISSQIELHKLYGGVVPEIASRKHVEKVNFVVREALKEAQRAAARWNLSGLSTARSCRAAGIPASSSIPASS